MHEETKNILSTVIESNLKAIKDPRPKLALLYDPNLLIELMQENQVWIEFYIDNTRKVLITLRSYLENIKSTINDITEQTHIVAIYLLLSSTFYEWDSFLNLASSWKYSSAYTILRKINEAIDQVELFIHDCRDQEDKNIQDWFSGKIIGNELSRKRIDAEMEKISEIDVKWLLSHLYQVESNPSHNGYSSILELVSPFTEDFDHTWPTWFHRTLSLVKSLYPINNLIRVLRLYYLLVVPDWKIELALKNIQKNWGADWESGITSEWVKTKFPKKK